jgi:cholesterol oxidase
MSKVPIFNQKMADSIKPIRFSKPLKGQVSSLQGSGDLLRQI